MTDATLEVQKTPEQLAKEKEEAELNVGKWANARAQLTALKELESELRAKVVGYYFPKGLKEGVNKAELPAGWGLKVTGKVNRKVEVETLPAVSIELREKHQVDVSEFIKYKPELSVTAYRQLQENVRTATEETKANHIAILKLFESMLIISDGSPEVELIEPKKPKAKVSTEV